MQRETSIGVHVEYGNGHVTLIDHVEFRAVVIERSMVPAANRDDCLQSRNCRPSGTVSRILQACESLYNLHLADFERNYVYGCFGRIRTEGNILCKETFQCSQISLLSGTDKGLQKTPLLARTDRCPPVAGEMFAGSGDELSGVCFFHLQ